MELTTLQKFCIWVIPVLFAVTIHEVAHGWVAKACGDPTASILGRLTLNPFKHLDLVGSVIVPALLLMLGGFIFGWAKPVPIQTRYFRHFRRDIALVALAGPFSNLCMAFGWAIAAKFGTLLLAQNYTIGIPMTLMGLAGIEINLALFLLNIIPIPPLDGSRVLSVLLPLSLDRVYQRVEPFGFVILLVLMFSGIFSLWINPIFNICHRAIIQTFGLFPV